MNAIRSVTASHPAPLAAGALLWMIAASGCGETEQLADPDLVLNDCAPDSFVTSPQRGTLKIEFGHELGHNYDPRCARFVVGDIIRFEGPFTIHPLVPGRIEAGLPIGDGDSNEGPIRAVRDGLRAEFIADRLWRFGYY